MKTSNKLFITALLVMLISIVFANVQLKSTYLRMKKLGPEKYKAEHRFDNFEKVKVSRFTEIDFKAANVVSINIEYGDEAAVWMNKWNKDKFHVHQEGNKLVVDLSEAAKKEQYSSHQSKITIILPKLSKFTTNHVAIKTKEEEYRYKEFETWVTGFSQESLELNLNPLSKVKLQNNRLKRLNAMVGKSDAASCILSVESDNKIETLKLAVFGKSKVEILAPEIGTINHQLSDDAVVTFRGNVLPKLK